MCVEVEPAREFDVALVGYGIGAAGLVSPTCRERGEDRIGEVIACGTVGGVEIWPTKESLRSASIGSQSELA